MLRSLKSARNRIIAGNLELALWTMSAKLEVFDEDVSARLANLRFLTVFSA
jgi:hypothetical protein